MRIKIRGLHPTIFDALKLTMPECIKEGIKQEDPLEGLYDVYLQDVIFATGYNNTCFLSHNGKSFTLDAITFVEVSIV